MKKKREPYFPDLGTMKLQIRKMKLTLILTLLVFVTFGNSFSQVKLSLQFKRATIQELIETIEDQTDYVFLYKDEILDQKQRYSVDFEETSFEEVLNSICETANVDYEVRDDRQIILKEKVKVNSVTVLQDQKSITGIVTGNDGQPIPGVSVIVKGTTTGAVTNMEGEFRFEVSVSAEVLQFSFVGMKTQDVEIGTQSIFSVVMEDETLGIDEVIVVGYGTQKKSDITGTVASLSKERLDMVPNLSITQAIQGSLPGVMIQTNSSGSKPDQAIMVRGRNSITADNDPLIVVDGVPYGGSLSDINPNDVESIEVLKDASSAAIYGSRGANGVILITTKQGEVGKITVSYDVKTSIQQIINKPDYLTPDEYYDYKIERNEIRMTQSERDVYAAGTGPDWFDLASRQGRSQEHNLSVSGGSEKTKFYIGGGLTDVEGVAINDHFRRISTRINIETKITDWLTIGTRTNLSFEDESGDEANFEDCIEKNPLTTAYQESGQLTVWPWPEQLVVSNPLQGLLFDDKDLSYQVVTNNFALITVPFVEGLTYRLNTGVRIRATDNAQYRGTDTESGLPAGKADLSNSISNNTVIENIVSYSREFGNHSLFATGVYGYEGNKSTGFELDGEVFPNDFLSYHSIASAVIKEPSTSFRETSLISQMLRLNYAYDSRYLLTMTVRRDGFSGFGTDNKWGIFPSVALGWNIANEDFFPLNDMFSELKLRASYGTNGNQAIGAYESISRLVSANLASGGSTEIGYKPAELGNAELGWESSRTMNIGLDIGILDSRITANINYYLTNTFDLLLDRSISSVHGVTPVTHLNTTGDDSYSKGWKQPAITQNIGETENKGLELSITSRNIVKGKFHWSTTGNFSFNKNKIVSLYGLLDENGVEVDDAANNWFIGQPIRINYDYVWDGVWQLDEVDAAPATLNPVAGFVKLKDTDGDGIISAEDREIIGQHDPKIMWGLNNTFSYGDFKLNIFMHGVWGATVQDRMMAGMGAEIRYNTIAKDWWTPDNPTNAWPMNAQNSHVNSGHSGHIYADPSYVRIKDISLSYDLPQRLIGKIGLSRVRFYVTGRNLFTFTKWPGMDPELILDSDDPSSDNIQLRIPMVKEYVFGLNLGF